MAYYTLALYEAGAMSSVVKCPWRETELPLQIHGDNPILWRCISSWNNPIPVSKEFKNMGGKTMRLKRNPRESGGSDVHLKGSADACITMDGNVDYKQQWVLEICNCK